MKGEQESIKNLKTNNNCNFHSWAESLAIHWIVMEQSKIKTMPRSRSSQKSKSYDWPTLSHTILDKTKIHSLSSLKLATSNRLMILAPPVVDWNHWSPQRAYWSPRLRLELTHLLTIYSMQLDHFSSALTLSFLSSRHPLPYHNSFFVKFSFLIRGLSLKFLKWSKLLIQWPHPYTIHTPVHSPLSTVCIPSSRRHVNQIDASLRKVNNSLTMYRPQCYKPNTHWPSSGPFSKSGRNVSPCSRGRPVGWHLFPRRAHRNSLFIARSQCPAIARGKLVVDGIYMFPTS